jgi:hypothetical protein
VVDADDEREPEVRLTPRREAEVDGEEQVEEDMVMVDGETEMILGSRMRKGWSRGDAIGREIRDRR